ncbi:LPS-assembly lipoprotein LptE [Coxiella endosymbiont of Dermacentor marginatus]|uniref:LPS-assembly lipoprotein LptE n=1 Tax=Coxiella endosymbiont of Dermacentor marginatus TaxID=1656159 RepID=UPI002221D539|nr:LPS assembly lipoprotein LptE [Coxiella endosymbiont of Dermacentor marginatus]
MISKTRTLLILLIGIFICSILGCGFKLRSSKDIPFYLRTLYIDSPNPYDSFTVQLKRTFKALNIHLTRTGGENAPIVFRIINVNWNPLIPAVLYSSATTSYTYLLSVNFDLETRSGHILMGPKNLTLRRRLIQNTNQIYTPNATRLMKQEMIKTMVSLIYRELVAYDMKI